MRKIRNQNGFTMAELLVSLLIMGMLGVLVTGGISSAGRVRKNAVEFSNANLLASTLTEAAADELRYALNIKETDNAVTFDSVRYGANVTVWADNGRLKVGSNTLVGEGTYTDGLCVDQFDLNYQNGLFHLVMTIVNEEDKVLAEVGTAEEPVIIAPLNP